MQTFRSLLIWFFVLTLFSGCLPNQSESPNFLILIADDQRWDQLSYADHPIIPELKTPHIDQLAKDGVYFRNAFVTTSICAVSRACIMSGMYVGTHGMNHFNTPIEPSILNQTYPALLKQNGYRTGVLGKWGMGIEGADKIFDVFTAWANQGADFHRTDSGKIHNSEWLAHEARKFLESQPADQPFCLTICYKAPHHPYQPDERDQNLFEEVVIPKRQTDTPEDYQGMAPHVMDSSLNRWCYFDERRDEATKDDFEKNFLRCVISLDRSVGKVRQTLKDLDLSDNTVTIFLSDNGYLWGEHGLGGKWLMYEESIRVPIIIQDPRQAKKKQGKILDAMALNIDIAPTILDLAGIPIPDLMDGISLVPQVKGSGSSLRSEFFMEHVGIIDVENPIPDCRGIRSEEWKYIRYVNTEPEVEELYYLAIDPYETNNLAKNTDYQSVLDELRKNYDQFFNH